MKKKFWDQGIRFECQGSGRCCTARGTYGYVYLTIQDRRRLAAHLKITTLQFTKTYCGKTKGYFHLRAPEKDCEFLEGSRCNVYEGRPSQCRTWPFWPENMNARTWAKEMVSFCPGIGKGRTYSRQEIEGLLKEDPLTNPS